MESMELRLAPGLLEQIIQEASAAAPRESCGLLAGRGVAERFIPMKNVAESSSEYEMDPAELIAAFRGLRDSGEELLAIYHSHPHGPAELSRNDIDDLSYPDAAQLIVSLANPGRPKCAAFRVIDGQALEIEVHAIV